MDPMVQSQVKEWFLMLAGWGFFGACVYMIAVAIRRRQQNAMQKHMLEKFSSAQDFAAFVQSPAGQKYVMSFSEAVASPGNTILSSVRIGIVLASLGLALIVEAFSQHFAVAQGSPGPVPLAMHALGMILLFLGVGFLVSAAASYFLAKKIGLTEKE